MTAKKKGRHHSKEPAAIRDSAEVLASRAPIDRYVAIFVVLTILFVFIVYTRVFCSQSVPYYHPDSADCFYWTEAAFHFRHFQFVADGRSIPKLDRQIQYPEGLDTRRYITPVMENFYGHIHRWFFHSVPRHRFLILAASIVATCSVLACFWAGREVHGSLWVGLISAACYGLAAAAVARSTATFLRENFTLPLLFCSFACLVSCMRNDRWPVATAGAVSLVIALASWHVSQFFFPILVTGLAILALLHGPQSLPRTALFIYVGAATAAAVALPVLRTKYYVVSVPMMMSYALLVVAWLPRRANLGRWKTVAVTLGLLCVSGSIGFLIQVLSGTHSHVFAVIWAKLRFLGSLPEDPSMLTFEAKSMWSSSFLSPTLFELFMMYTTTGALAMIGLAVVGWQIYQGRRTEMTTWLIFWVLVTAGLAMMFVRLSVFAIFFLALLAGYSWPRRRGWPQYVVALALIGCFVFEGAKYYGPGILPAWRMVAYRPPQKDLVDVVNQLRTHAAPDDPVVASFELGPSIAAYANRPVLLHSKFESPALREKVNEVYSAFFENEETFYDLCTRYGAKWVVYQRNWGIGLGPGSIAYSVGLGDLPLSSAVFAFHFAPERLRNFQLVAQNSTYRVYRVGHASDGAPWRPPYAHEYDLSFFVHGEPTGALTREQLQEGNQKLSEVKYLANRARAMAKADKLDDAVTHYVQALQLNPNYLPALVGASHALSRLQQHGPAAQALETAMNIDPRVEPEESGQLPPDALITLAAVKGYREDYMAAERLLRRALEQDQQSWQAYKYLGFIRARQNRIEDAEAFYRNALQINPQAVTVYELLGKLLARQGQNREAIKMVEKALQIEPNQPQLRQVLSELRAMAPTSPSTEP